MHHIVSDAWSFYVFGQELAEFYEAAVTGRPPRLSELPIQYAEFGQRQRQSLAGQVYEQQLAYWRNHLEGEVSRLLVAHRSSLIGRHEPRRVPDPDDPGGRHFRRLAS